MAERMPCGARLVRIREQLVELCRKHAPDQVPEAERLLEAARNPKGEQLGLFEGTAFRVVLAALQAKPWQTQAELSELLGYSAGKALLRLQRKGRVRRRVGQRSHNPYEYALAGGQPS